MDCRNVVNHSSGHIAFGNMNSMDILETDISMVAVWSNGIIWINTDLLSTEPQTSIKFESTCIIILIQENIFEIPYFRPYHKQTSVPPSLSMFHKSIISKLNRESLNPWCAKLFRENKSIYLHWHDTGSWNPSSSKERIYLICTFNIMAADDMATQGARASATMIFRLLNQINLITAC